MNRAIKAWLEQEGYGDETSISDDVVKQLVPSYTTYGDMLLLSPRAFESQSWQALRQQRVRCSPSDSSNDRTAADSDLEFESLYKLWAHYMKISHIAIIQPIPLTINQNANNETVESTANVLRSPTNFTPLYGDFGPTTCSTPTPTFEDFSAAYWVTAKQNGILQTWAPRWTMFSRGNVAEKARLLTLPSVLRAVNERLTGAEGSRDGIAVADDNDGAGGDAVDPSGCAAVDLYAGIGYFAFSYLKAGVSKVLCWEINPWSIEGLRRGAEANRWKAAVLDHQGMEKKDGWVAENFGMDERLIIFPESNEHAAARIEKMRAALPPIRHVNCGLLPTSRGSWGTALQVLDPDREGWVHVHENFAVAEIDAKAEEVRQTFEKLDQHYHGREIKLDFIHRLKSYAPGVMHCVLDICVIPLEIK